MGLELQNPEFKISNCENPEFKILNLPKSWIADFGSPKSWIQHFRSPKSWIQDFSSPKSWIQDFGSPKSWIQHFGSPKSWIHDFGSPKSWTQHFGSPKWRIQDFGSLKSWIQEILHLKDNNIVYPSRVKGCHCLYLINSCVKKGIEINAVYLWAVTVHFVFSDNCQKACYWLALIMRFCMYMYLACSGLPTLSHKKNLPESQLCQQYRTHTRRNNRKMFMFAQMFIFKWSFLSLLLKLSSASEFN